MMHHAIVVRRPTGRLSIGRHLEEVNWSYTARVFPTENHSGGKENERKTLVDSDCLPASINHNCDLLPVDFF